LEQKSGIPVEDHLIEVGYFFNMKGLVFSSNVLYEMLRTLPTTHPDVETAEQVPHNLPEDLHDDVMDAPTVSAHHVQDTSNKTVPLDLLEDIIEIPTDSAHF
jgi:hypothetical protein